MGIVYKPSERTYVYDCSDMVTPMDEIRQKVINTLKNDYENKVRDALIELGWTPPRS